MTWLDTLYPQLSSTCHATPRTGKREILPFLSLHFPVKNAQQLALSVFRNRLLGSLLLHCIAGRSRDTFGLLLVVLIWACHVRRSVWCVFGRLPSNHCPWPLALHQRLLASVRWVSFGLSCWLLLWHLASASCRPKAPSVLWCYPLAPFPVVFLVVVSVIPTVLIKTLLA